MSTAFLSKVCSYNIVNLIRGMLSSRYNLNRKSVVDFFVMRRPPPTFHNKTHAAL
jgi:hypothetical protein